MQNLKNAEYEICRLADTDPAAAQALHLLGVQFKNDMPAHAYLIGKIYIERKPEKIWKLAVCGHISESTAYRYRHAYIAAFYDFYGKLCNRQCETVVQQNSRPTAN